MNKIKLHTISNMLFISAVFMGIFSLGKTFYERSRLPEGVCPIDNNRSMMIIGAILLLLYIVVSTVEDYINKKDKI
ncbi:hypothetical protein [Oceanirhabdus sp. W0125-5]|uniref:hypothetical protein n=1 Tax=Oceanirhabdus sp. W0125-5 TaxID=2999116 RepID=UPI0022F311C0|nr:hypothetical protein [Oceanirhabdus sp. W0125-5]WBW99142.1 hypothetical protein OW730_10460 [Oceanirhabdus sp. W0125-5]